MLCIEENQIAAVSMRESFSELLRKVTPFISSLGYTDAGID
jgi:hypothetical protein